MVTSSNAYSTHTLQPMHSQFTPLPQYSACCMPFALLLVRRRGGSRAASDSNSLFAFEALATGSTETDGVVQVSKYIA
jgi:hypothetical protein